MGRIVLVAVVLACASGCVSLSPTERATLGELRSHGISETAVQKKDPAVAGVLNVLPGFGNFYLAIDTQESNQWIFGAINLLLWPVSVIWGIPQAVLDAETINKKETIYYYTYDPQGKREFEKRKAEIQERK